MKDTAQLLAKRIEDLGYTLVVRHYRYDKRLDFRSQKFRLGSPVRSRPLHSSKFAARGGCTIATVYDKKGWMVCMATALCSTKDNFKKSIGWVKAVGRAYSMIPLFYHVPFSEPRETINK